MASAGSAALEDGWRATTPADDTLVRTYVLGFGTWLAALGAASGARVLRDDDVTALDVGSRFFLANGAVVHRPLRGDEWPALVARLQEFFAGGPGGSWVLISAAPTPDLRADLELVGHPPFMVRAAGGTPPPDPEGLEVIEATDDGARRDFARALEEGYPAPDATFLADPRLSAVEGMRCFVGYLDGAPVATSAVHTFAGCSHVEWVSTHPSVRGRGVGAALTWRAALAVPGVPSVLLASDPGQPVYARMGYLRALRFTVWSGARRA
jgi:hypothetical protein